MADPILLYGAYGYTGRLLARRARALGVPLRLAGRDAAKLHEVASATGHASVVVPLEDGAGLRAAVAASSCVLHAAGPFSRTSRPMVDACIASRRPYLDVTGEIEVFEALAARDAEAKGAGVGLLPGAGFDVVPSDCLAAHLHRRLPEAVSLTLAFRMRGGAVSHGTATTMVESAHRGGAIRRGGRIVPVPVGHLSRDVPFPSGVRRCAAIPWGDVSTAFHSTGIPDIAVLIALPRSAGVMVRLARSFAPLLGTRAAQALLHRLVDARPAGPTDAQRARGSTELWGEAVAADGRRVAATLVTPEGYTITAAAALELAQRAARGLLPPGFQTPSRAFGADLVTELEGVTRVELA